MAGDAEGVWQSRTKAPVETPQSPSPLGGGRRRRNPRALLFPLPPSEGAGRGVTRGSQSFPWWCCCWCYTHTHAYSVVLVTTPTPPHCKTGGAGGARWRRGEAAGDAGRGGVRAVV